MKARSFVGSYLQQIDVVDEPLVTITSAKSVSFENEDREKLALYFEEFDKGLICNTTNIDLLTALFGGDETDDWIGKQITLYTDPTVIYGGKKVGGIRVRSGSPE